MRSFERIFGAAVESSGVLFSRNAEIGVTGPQHDVFPGNRTSATIRSKIARKREEYRNLWISVNFTL